MTALRLLGQICASQCNYEARDFCFHTIPEYYAVIHQELILNTCVELGVSRNI